MTVAATCVKPAKLKPSRLISRWPFASVWTLEVATFVKALPTDSVALFKASRVVGLDRIVQRLVAPNIGA